MMRVMKIHFWLVYCSLWRNKTCLDVGKVGVTLHCNSSTHKQFINAVYYIHSPSCMLGSCPAVSKTVNS